MNALDWGWKIENDLYVAITTDLKPAPDDILNVISCKCRMLKNNACSSQVCSCRKHGLKCVVACKHCCGKVCTNAEHRSSDVPETAELKANIDEPDEEENVRIVIDDLEFMVGVEMYEEVVVTNMDFNG
jgi:hypothetical protein